MQSQSLALPIQSIARTLLTGLLALLLLAQLMERNMQPVNAWQVLLDDEGKPYWVNSDGTVHTQPARGGMQRVMDVIFEVVPKEQN